MKVFTLNPTIALLKRQLRRRQLPTALFCVMCLNLAIASAVYATNSNQISQGQAYAIGLLALVTLAISIYLFAVIFVPEKF